MALNMASNMALNMALRWASSLSLKQTGWLAQQIAPYPRCPHRQVRPNRGKTQNPTRFGLNLPL